MSIYYLHQQFFESIRNIMCLALLHQKTYSHYTRVHLRISSWYHLFLLLRDLFQSESLILSFVSIKSWSMKSMTRWSRDSWRRICFIDSFLFFDLSNVSFFSHSWTFNMIRFRKRSSVTANRNFNRSELRQREIVEYFFSRTSTISNDNETNNVSHSVCVWFLDVYSCAESVMQINNSSSSIDDDENSNSYLIKRSKLKSTTDIDRYNETNNVVQFVSAWYSRYFFLCWECSANQ